MTPPRQLPGRSFMDIISIAEYDQIRFENELTRQRLAWMGATYALLLVAYWLLIKECWFAVMARVVPLVGVVVSVSVAVGVYAANKALDVLAGGEQNPEYGVLMSGVALPYVGMAFWAVMLFV